MGLLPRNSQYLEYFLFSLRRYQFAYDKKSDRAVSLDKMTVTWICLLTRVRIPYHSSKQPPLVERVAHYPCFHPYSPIKLQTRQGINQLAQIRGTHNIIALDVSSNFNTCTRVLIKYLPYSIGVQRLCMTKGPLRNQSFYAWRPLWVAGKDRGK